MRWSEFCVIRKKSEMWYKVVSSNFEFNMHYFGELALAMISVNVGLWLAPSACGLQKQRE